MKKLLSLAMAVLLTVCLAACLGAEQAEAYWRENGGFDMLLVTDKNEMLLTEGIAGQFSLSNRRSEVVRVIERGNRKMRLILL